MSTAAPKNANVRLLACPVDEDDTDDSDYRFLVDGRHVKYVTAAPGAFRGAEEDRTFAPVLLSELLPPFPPGSWNSGRVARDPETGKAVFVQTETVPLAGVQNLWHPVRQRVRVSTHPKLCNGVPVLVKLVVWPWEVPSMETETAAYRQMDGHGIAPRFLGHLIEGGQEDGRVVGFVTECVPGARAAGPGGVLAE